MGNKIVFFERNSEQQDFEKKEIQLKIRFIALILAAVIFITLVVTIYTFLFYGFCQSSVFAIAASVSMIISLAFLMKGRHSIAIHLLFVSGFTFLWLALIFESPIPLLSKMDSIVLIVGLFSAMAISMFNSRKPIVFYFVFNVVLFILFVFSLKRASLIPTNEIFEYFMDNIVALSFVFFVVMNAFTINKKIVSSLKNQLMKRINTQKAHQETINKLLDHLNNTPVGAIFWDLDYRVTEWNPSAERIFGYSKDEAMGMHPDDLILPDDVKEQMEQVFKDLLSGRGGERSINDNITKQGNRIIGDWYNSVLKDAEGKIIGITSLVNDITEKTKTHEMMIQSAKMLSIGGLAAGMAHEINNPIAGMIQNAQVVYNRLAKDLPANKSKAEQLGLSFPDIRCYAEERGVLDQLQSISGAGRRAAMIIDNMLNFSRKSDQTREAIRFQEVLEKTIALAETDYDLKKKYNFKSIEILKEYSSDLPEIYCNISKIQQVLFNLFKNACDSMNMKSYKNENPKLILRLKKEAKHICIEVQDNGKGMDDDIKAHVFEPFFTTKKKQGTGLGLSISYAIVVEEHGGQMAVESIPERGTKFLIKLPFRSTRDN